MADPYLSAVGTANLAQQHGIRFSPIRIPNKKLTVTAIETGGITFAIRRDINRKKVTFKIKCNNWEIVPIRQRVNKGDILRRPCIADLKAELAVGQELYGFVYRRADTVDSELDQFYINELYSEFRSRLIL